MFLNDLEVGGIQTEEEDEEKGLPERCAPQRLFFRFAARFLCRFLILLRSRFCGFLCFGRRSHLPACRIAEKDDKCIPEMTLPRRPDKGII